MLQCFDSYLKDHCTKLHTPVFKIFNSNVKYYVYASAQRISKMDHLEHPGNMKVICNY